MASRLGWLTLLAGLLLGPGDEGRTVEVPKKAAGRWHFVYAAEPRFEISVLFGRDASGDETRLLVSLPSGRFDLFSRQDPTGRVTFESVKDLSTGATIERRLFLPGPLLPKGCTQNASDACVEWKAAGGGRRTPLSGFSEQTTGAERDAVKKLLSPGLEASLRQLLATFPRSHEFDAYGDDFLYLIWPQPRRIRPVDHAERAPGCEFDATFGYPCSEDEKRREAARFPKDKGPGPAQ